MIDRIVRTLKHKLKVMKMQGFEWWVKRAGLRHLTGVLFGMLLLGLSGHASAQANCQDVAPDTYTITMPATVTVPRDAAVGTPLTAWFSTPQVMNYYTCTSAGGAFTGTEFSVLSLTRSGVTTTSGGTT